MLFFASLGLSCRLWKCRGQVAAFTGGEEWFSPPVQWQSMEEDVRGFDVRGSVFEWRALPALAVVSPPVAHCWLAIPAGQGWALPQPAARALLMFCSLLPCSGHVQRAFPPRSHRVLQVWQWDPNKEQKRLRSAKWGEIHEPKRVDVARLRPAKCSLTEPYLWMQLNPYSRSFIPTFRCPGQAPSSTAAPYHHQIFWLPKDSPGMEEVPVHSTGHESSSTAAGTPPRRNVQLFLSLTFSFSLSLSPMLCGKRNKNISQHPLLIRICFPTQKKTTFAFQRKF